MVFKGNIESITDNELRIRLRAAQQNPLVFPENSRYAVEHDTMDTTFRSMYLGLSSFMDANPERRELLLGQRPPRFDMAYEDRIARTTDDFERVALKAEAACDYFLLVGPPGTGKTSRALRRMVEHFMLVLPHKCCCWLILIGRWTRYAGRFLPFCRKWTIYGWGVNCLVMRVSANICWKMCWQNATIVGR